MIAERFSPAVWCRDESELLLPPGEVARCLSTAMGGELAITPKPGLVDRANSGAHRDMSLATFERSVAALRPMWVRFCERVVTARGMDASARFSLARWEGVRVERTMFAATGGINTHKGQVFVLATLAAAYAHAAPHTATGVRWSESCGVLCRDLVTRDLVSSSRPPRTNGERLYHRHHLTGVRGEAQRGFPTIFRVALPVYRASMARGWSHNGSALLALIASMARAEDTTIVHRGGLSALEWVQRRANELFTRASSWSEGTFTDRVRQFDRACISCHLSPGGSADLLAGALFCEGLWGRIVLADRERRSAFTTRLADDTRAPVVVIAPNAPGPDKHPWWACALVEEVATHFRGTIKRINPSCDPITIWWREGESGVSAHIAIDCPPELLKRVAVELEEAKDAFRMVDIDVHATSGRQLSRRDLGLRARRCIVCGGDAAACVRARTHSLSEVTTRIEKAVRSISLPLSPEVRNLERSSKN